MNLVPIEAPTLAPRRRAAPYTREVVAEIEAGREPNVMLFCGLGGWSRAERRRAQRGFGTALVLPVDADPKTLKWPPLDTIFVDARTLSRRRAIDLGASLICDGCRYAAVLGPGDEPLNFWREGGKS